MFKDLSSLTFANHAIHHFQRPQGLGQIDRPRDFDRAGDRVR